MIYQKWSNELNIGINEMDVQHRHLAGFINVLAISRNAGAGHEQLVRIFEDLIADVLVHFAFEAEMFERSGYVHAQEHKRSHTALLRKLNEYRSRFRAGEDVLDIVLNTLETWLPNHIRHDDAKYAAFLAEARNAAEETGNVKAIYLGLRSFGNNVKPAGLKPS
jgi:hemerythrin